MINPSNISPALLLTIIGIFTAWFTFFLLLSDRYWTRITNLGIQNLLLRYRFYGLERFIFTQLLFLICILSVLVLSPIISILLHRFLFIDENIAIYRLCGSSYLAVAADSLIVFHGAYSLNRLHRSLRHDLRVMGYIRSA